MKVMFFSNGNTVAFDDDDQAPEFSESWFKMYIEFLKGKGIKPEDVEFTMPNHTKAEYLPKYDNWRIL